MTFLLPAGSLPPPHRIANSLRFRASNSAYLSRTFSAGNAQIFSVVRRMKRGTLGAIQFVIGAIGTWPGMDIVRFDASDRLDIQLDNANGGWLISNAVFRDPTAWGTLLIAVNTTLATASQRVRAYWNDQEITSWSTNTQPAQNYNFLYFNAARVHELGRDPVNANKWFDGYSTEDMWVNGVQLTPSAIGGVDPISGAWRPKRYIPPAGTNNYLLEYKDASAATAAAIGKDTSGNGNNWTPNGISVTAGVTFDQMTDTPTNNHATLAPANWHGPRTGTIVAAQAGNLDVPVSIAPGVCAWALDASFGKIYHEVTSGPPSGGYPIIGCFDTSYASSDFQGGPGHVAANGVGYWSNGRLRINNTTTIDAWGATFTAGDVIGVAIDTTNGNIWFSKNGVWQGGGDPAAGTSPAATMTTGRYIPGANSQVGLAGNYNFGQRAFAYTPPTGFVALNTANLATPTIRRGDDAFFAGLRTGTGATASVSSLRFQPDLVWIKSRSAATNHNLFDGMRGVQNGIVSNSTAAEYSDAASLTAFNANGFSLGADGGSRGVNINTNTYADAAWRGGAAYGFDIVTYTGNGVNNRDIAHSLNAIPHFGIVKRRNLDGGRHWMVKHRSQAANNNLILSLVDAQFIPTNAAFGGLADFSSPSTFRVVAGVTDISAVNGNTDTYVAYLWTSIPGFSLFGAYTGNGGADGPFVWCGFRPRFVLMKAASSTGNWEIIDTARDTFNVATWGLYPNLPNAEASTGGSLDVTANGFKLRRSGADVNASGVTYIFAAFAETPFKFATAR